MSDMTTPSPNRGNWLRLGIIGMGTVVFLLLFFADKTNLNNPEQARKVAAGVQTTTGNTSTLPPLAPDAEFDSWASKLSEVSEEEKGLLLDSMISSLIERNRFGHAANYLEQRLESDRSLEIQRLAGIVNQQATELSYVSRDSILFRTFTERAISYLSAVLEAQPEDEQSLLYLGLALVQSGQPQNSMRGILSIRKVLEINPDNLEAGLRLGIFSLQTGQLDKAEQRFQHILQLEPENQLARLQLAVTRIRQERLPEAQQLLERVVQEASDNELKLEARELLISLNTK